MSRIIGRVTMAKIVNGRASHRAAVSGICKAIVFGINSPKTTCRKVISTNAMMARQIVYVVGELFRGGISLKQLEGPLGIAKASGDAAKEGLSELFSLMAMIGINLAVLNLLPIPPLDGGHILMLFIEGTMRRDLSLRVKERFVTVSMVFLLLVFAIVMYNDVARLIPHH